MIAYIDSSVLLRVVLEQPSSLREWPEIEHAVSSVLLSVECSRTIDRFRLRNRGVVAIAELRESLSARLEATELLPLNKIVLDRASLPLSVELGTPGSIHLATAMIYRERVSSDLVVATHDAALAAAARSFGFSVVGA